MRASACNASGFCGQVRRLARGAREARGEGGAGKAAAEGSGARKSAGDRSAATALGIEVAGKSAAAADRGDRGHGERGGGAAGGSGSPETSRRRRPAVWGQGKNRGGGTALRRFRRCRDGRRRWRGFEGAGKVTAAAPGVRGRGENARLWEPVGSAARGIGRRAAAAGLAAEGEGGDVAAGAAGAGWREIEGRAAAFPAHPRAAAFRDVDRGPAVAS
jgi:hypothetical protein